MFKVLNISNLLVSVVLVRLNIENSIGDGGASGIFDKLDSLTSLKSLCLDSLMLIVSK